MEVLLVEFAGLACDAMDLCPCCGFDEHALTRGYFLCTHYVEFLVEVVICCPDPHGLDVGR